MKLSIKYSARSDKGLVRKNNEDTVYAGNRLLAVADGMGGHVGGEIASQIIISHIASLDTLDSKENPLADLENTIYLGNEAIKKAIVENEDLKGMGTTLTALLFNGPKVALAHIGDSRAYLLRNNQLEQITRDDTLVQRMIEDGEITPEEALTHPQKSIIMQAINGEKIYPDLSFREMQPNDVYLICSDGLTDVLSDETIQETLISSKTVEEATENLIQLTLENGAPDNVTVVVAKSTETNYLQTEPIIDGAVNEQKLDTKQSENLKNKSKSKKIWWLTIPIILITLMAGIFTTNHYLRSNYYLSLDNNIVSVYKGLRGKVLGIKFQELDSKVCIQNLHKSRTISEKQISYYQANISPPKNCIPLSTDLLEKSSILSIASLPNESNFNKINNQVNNLVSKIIPPCKIENKKNKSIKPFKIKCRKILE